MSAGAHDAVTHAVTPHDVPSVPRHIARAAAGTFAVLLAGALVLGVVASWDRISVLWYRAAGDPSIRLADGVSLPSSPQTVSVPVVRFTTWPVSDDVARIGAGTGFPVHQIDASVARQMLGDAGAMYVAAGQRRVYGTPLGIVTIVEFEADPGSDVEGRVMLFATPTTSTPTTAAGRAELLGRLAIAWGAGASSAVPAAKVRVDPPSTMKVYGARVVLGDVVTEPGSAGWADFVADGRLSMATVPIARVVGATTVQVGSPAAAFDAVRHHAEGTMADPMTATAAHLVAQNLVDSATPGDLFWVFTDAAGNDVDVAPAG